MSERSIYVRWRLWALRAKVQGLKYSRLAARAAASPVGQRQVPRRLPLNPGLPSQAREDVTTDCE